MNEKETIEKFIERHEGRRNKPYKCPASKNTIGVGWNFDDNPLPKSIADYLEVHGEITDDMVNLLLSLSVKNAIKDCLDLFPTWDSISLKRRMALIDFVFQLGKHRTSHFVNTIAAINTGRWEDAAEGIRKSLYWKQLGGDPPGTDDGKLERPEEIANMILEG
jgi:GH24 family phage-related lysozyme (muramidase)